MQKCRVEGCDRDATTGRGWCWAHYMRWHYSGKEPTPGSIRPYGATPEELFWRNVDKRGPEECWLWLASRSAKGYGHASFKGKWTSPHRFSYELHKGAIPEGLTIDHLCRNKACVNPAHLEAVTAAENTRRRFALQTHCKRGHEFTPENTHRHSITGNRVCRTCIREYNAARPKKKRAANG